MTNLEIKVEKLKDAYQIWDSLTPLEKYNKVMIHFTPKERKGVNGLRRMAQFIIDNNITK